MQLQQRYLINNRKKLKKMFISSKNNNEGRKLSKDIAD